MIAAVGLALCAGSCSDEDVTPSYADKNLFATADNDASEDAALRRDFFKENGVYLLFNDTLRHDYIGKDAFGDDVYDTEIVDLDYNITGSGSKYTYETEYYTTLEEKQAGTDFVTEYIMPHFKGGSLCPYSFFLIKSLQYQDYGRWKDLKYKACVRCMALALGDITELTEEEKADMGATLCLSILKEKLSYRDERLDDFHAISNDYTREYFEDVVDGWYDDEHTPEEAQETAYEYGFLSYSGWSSWYFPWSDDDYDDYFELVMTTSEEDVREQYGDYPLVLNKYMILRNIITSLGYKF